MWKEYIECNLYSSHGLRESLMSPEDDFALRSQEAKILKEMLINYDSNVRPKDMENGG